MALINQTLMMAFLGVMAICSIVFPILFLVQRRRQHKEFMNVLRDCNDHVKVIDKCKK